MISRRVALGSGLALAGMLAGCASLPPADDAAGPVTVGIVAINDFHGALEPPGRTVDVPDGKGGALEVPAGGAAWLASAMDSLRGRYRYHLTVSAGDLIGASQFASAIHLDEPAIGVANRMGLDFDAVGNHEFDRGRDELLRMQHGGCARFTPRRPCAVEPHFAGARFAFLAANTRKENGATLFPATALRHFGKGRRKVTVGVIGVTLAATPQLVAPQGVAGLTFADEAETINALVPGLKAKGADAIVVLIHQGGAQASPPGTVADPNGCAALGGAIRAILDRLKPGVDAVVSGHTHRAYICDYTPAGGGTPILLTSAGLYGEMVSDIALDIDPQAGRVVAHRARNLIVQSEGFGEGAGRHDPVDVYPRFAPRADIAAYIDRYSRASAAFARRPAGRLAGPIGMSEGEHRYLGGSLGNLVADAQLAATRGAGAQIALTNPFGIRASLVPAADGTLSYASLFAAQPFDQRLMTQSLTGAELKALLEQDFRETGEMQILSPSAGFAYTWDRRRPIGARIVAMTLDGRAIDPAATYRVTTNAFLAGGGDGFTVLATQREAIAGSSDLEALEAWLQGDRPRAIPAEDRTPELTP